MCHIGETQVIAEKKQKLDVMFGFKILNISVQVKLATADRTHKLFPDR